MNTEKLISALCITYGRPHNLEEALESFLRQDYPNKELIIINDLAEQTLIFDHPQVKIFNYKERFPTIGDKRNKSIELSSGEILMSWDDDDTYLPWILSFFVKEFEANPSLGFIQPNRSWKFSDNKLYTSEGWCANSAFTRKACDAVGGYHVMNSGQDRNFIKKLKNYLHPIKGAKVLPITIEEAAYIFHWGGTGSYHLSSYGRDKEGCISGYNKIEEYIKSKSIEPIVNLNPHWNHDYLKMTDDFIKNNPI